MTRALPNKVLRKRAQLLSVNMPRHPERPASSPRTTTMNFKVPEEFHREFKIYAAQHGLKMVEVLERSFRLLKDEHGS
jgi:hypothetical protein